MLAILSIGFPAVFLGVAAFMTNAVLSRLLALQREQIAILRAFGFTRRQITAHYLKFAFGVIYNNARISLAERARELATLRVIGLTQREVGAVLVIEQVILALFAVPCGLLFGTGLTSLIISSVNTETVRLPLVFTDYTYSFAVLVVTIASTLSAMFALRKLRRLDLIAVLKAPE